jgi:hypothetical protein
VNDGRPVAEAFSGEGAGSLAALRLSFLREGFLSRQERLLRDLRAAGWSPATIYALRLGEVLMQDDTIVIRQPGCAPVESGSAAILYKHDGHDLFVIDCHMHLWDANPENWRNKYRETCRSVVIHPGHSHVSLPASRPGLERVPSTQGRRSCIARASHGIRSWTTTPGGGPQHRHPDGLRGRSGMTSVAEFPTTTEFGPGLPFRWRYGSNSALRPSVRLLALGE